MRTRNDHSAGRRGISRLDMSATPCSGSVKEVHDEDPGTAVPPYIGCSSSMTEADPSQSADELVSPEPQGTNIGIVDPVSAEHGAQAGEGHIISELHIAPRGSRWDPLLDTLAWSMLIWAPVCMWLAVQVQS